MWTETYAQIMDRAIIERLKEEEFTKADKPELAQKAKGQAITLESSAKTYVRQVINGEWEHIPHAHLRFHDHGGETSLPATEEECLVELQRVHRTYWDTQTAIQEAKIDIDGGSDGRLLGFYDLQLTIDKCNQRRNEVRSHADLLLAEELDRYKYI